MDDPDTFHGWSRRRLSYVSMNANAADLVDGEMVSTAEDVPHAPVDPDQPTEGEVVADDYQYDTVNPDASLRAAPLYPVPDVLFPVSVVMDNFDAYGEEDSDDDGPMEQAAPALHPLGGTDISNRSWYSPSKRRAGLGTMRRNELTSRTVNFTGLEMHRLGDLPEEMSSTNLLPENTSAGSSNSSVEFPEHNGDVSETSTLPSDACFVDHLLAVVERSTRELWRNKLELLLEMVVPLIFMIVSVILWVIWGTQFNEKMSYVSIDMGDRGVGAAGTGAPVIGDFTCMRQPDGTPQLSGFIRCQAMNISTCDNATGVCETHTIEPFTCDGDSSMLPLPSGYEICRVGFPWHEIITGSLSHYWRWLSAVPTLDTLISIQWTALAATRHILPYIVRTMVGLADNTRYSAILCSGALYFVGEYTATTQLMAYINKTSALFPYVTDFMVYGSVAEARKASQRGGRLWAIVELREISDAGLDVVLHMNNSALPSFTTTYDVAYGGGVLFDTAELYMLSGFNTLQQLVSEFYLNVFHKAVMNMTQMMASMATPEYDRVPLMTQAREILPLIFSMAFLYSVSKQTKRIVLEKELRIRESMLIMGLKQWTLYVSDFIVQLGIFVPTCVLCVVILKVTYITKSDPMILFLIFFLFALTTIPLSGMIATFFSKSRLASLVAPVVYFILVVPMFAMSNAQGPIVIWFSLFSPTGFAAALNVFLVHESGSGCGPPEMTSNRDNPTLAVLLIMMGVDFCVYCVLMLYLDNVMPKQWGTPKHPLFFIIDPVQWYRGSRTRVLEGGEDGRAENGVFEVTDYSKDSMSFQGLRKEYLRDGRKFTAVNNLYWGMREGEISVLLGHNGAGKTTVLNMVTGMVEPDEGDCYVYGMSVRTQLDKVRQQIGYCPQHNILWSELTCRDHLEFFGRIKGLRGWELEDAVCRMLHETDLLEKMDQPTKRLSGGMKRKLSIAVAFVGGSRVVFLDEPTAGMDVGARRYTWDLLKRMSRSCTVLLTTHYMDEADLLGKRIGIMSQGRLKCSGSSLFLKSRLGVGYNIVISVDPELDLDAVDEVVLGTVDGAKPLGRNGCEVSYQLPAESASQFPALLGKIDSVEADGIRGYSLAATTLEEVFLKVSEEDIEGRNESAAQEGVELIWNCEVTPSVLCQQFRAMMMKRFWSALRDRKMQCFQIVCPVVCIFMAMLLNLVQYRAPQSLTYDYSMFTDLPTSVLHTSFCDVMWGNSTTGAVNYEVNETHMTGAEAMSDYLLDTWYVHDRPRFGAVSCIDRNLTAMLNFLNQSRGTNVNVFLYNTSSHHQAGLNLATYYDLFIKSFLGTDSAFMRYKVELFEKPRSQSQLEFIFIGALVMVPLTFLPSSAVSWIVKERQCGSRHLQDLCGLNFLVYWAANFTFDMAAYCTTMLLCILIFAMFRRVEFIGNDRAGATLTLFLVYGLTSTVYAYALSFLFTEHASAQTTVMGIGFVSGFLLLMLVHMLALDPGKVDTSDKVRWGARVVPSYCIGEGLIELLTLESKLIMGTATSAWGMDQLGWPLVYMAAEFPVLWLVVLLVDHPVVRRFFERRHYKREATPIIPSDEDSDVEDEREAVYEAARMGDTTSDVLRVVNLQKRYGNGTFAVKGITFSIFPGEVFGLLGTNGAGKTTTISMLCQLFLPTGGSAYICGYDIVTQRKEALQCIGYCPQFDATLDLLTVEEQLELYAGIRGIARTQWPALVDALCRLCELTMHRKTLTYALSGGNRRKLSVAMALVGGPQVVFLDEPSAGMDPVARRGLWTAIQHAALHSSVVLTTHHLEEVEALADIVSIMVRGCMRCIGDKVHLKNKFGSAFEVSVRLSSAKHAGCFVSFMKAEFPDAVLNEGEGQRFVYQLPRNRGFGDVFQTLQANKEDLHITDYGVSQTTIEQIFMKVRGLARNAEKSMA
ncbi:ATP-binding cassette protein subfamily A, member 3, putative [Leishmania tarentolae]|uniref:ATP-binding cassette protein subfamily A, member 3, putative n=1 Tax=Leishmania tarentolae TaxID=5689 RepID=A0A640KBD3_LEITA|nr:ATP-binding cassette protein subfamily A, member 3, putative [Leishmania tarentolae]